MRFAVLDPKTECVTNLIEAEQAFVDGTPDPSIYIPLDDTGEKHGGIPVQFGDECTDRVARLFIRPLDPTLLLAAKLDAATDMDTLKATLESVTDGSLKTAIQAATTVDEVDAIRAKLAAAIQANV